MEMLRGRTLSELTGSSTWLLPYLLVRMEG